MGHFNPKLEDHCAQTNEMCTNGFYIIVVIGAEWKKLLPNKLTRSIVGTDKANADIDRTQENFSETRKQHPDIWSAISVYLHRYSIAQGGCLPCTMEPRNINWIPKQWTSGARSSYQSLNVDLSGLLIVTNSLAYFCFFFCHNLRVYRQVDNLSCSKSFLSVKHVGTSVAAFSHVF